MQMSVSHLSEDTDVGGAASDEHISLSQSDLNGLLKWVVFVLFNTGQ